MLQTALTLRNNHRRRRMSQKFKSSMFRPGISLAEVMTCVAVMLLVVVGASAYTYHASLEARRASMRITAARSAAMFCETWRGLKGSQTFDPLAYFPSEFNVLQPVSWTGTQHIEPDFTHLGSYKIRLQKFKYGIVLSSKDISSNLRALNVVVEWPIAELGQMEQKYTIRLTAFTPI